MLGDTESHMSGLVSLQGDIPAVELVRRVLEVGKADPHRGCLLDLEGKDLVAA